MERRRFLTSMVAGLGLMGAPGLLRAAAEAAPRPLKLLILGGTQPRDTRDQQRSRGACSAYAE